MEHSRQADSFPLFQMVINLLTTVSAPSVPTVLKLPTATNLLCTSLNVLPLAGATDARPFILASTADRRLNVISPGPQKFDVVHSFTKLQDSPILSYTIIAKRYLVCTSMSGKVVVFDGKKDEVVAQRKDHTKYVVQVSSQEDSNGKVWIATAGWDGKVLVYLVHLYDPDDFPLGEPLGSIQLPANPEALLFVRHPDSDDLYLLVTRRDSSWLFYYKIAEDMFAAPTPQPSPIPLSGKQNLAPYSNAWVAFTPAAILPSPVDPTLIAVATSTVPHMKLLIVRLLFPINDDSAIGETLPLPILSPTSLFDPAAASTPAAQQGRAALALQDREAAAIMVQCNTMAPQTQYSSPSLAWRPDGSGVWVNSDDGVVRGIEAITGKVTDKLVGHVVGSKIRCLWAGHVDVGGGNFEEWVLSGGFDQQLIVWRVQQ
jgi:WD40 repeat protein